MAAIAQHRVTHSTAYRVRKLRNQVLFWFVIALFIIFACFPVYWMFVTTFKEVNDLYNLQNNPLLFHLPPTLEQVQYLFEKTNFATWVENTAEVGGAVVLITVLICVPAAYALARVRFPGSGSLGIGIFLTYLVPPTLLFLPLSQLVAGFGLNNSKWSLAYALTFVSSSDEKMITLGVVTDLIRGDVFFWGSLMAGALIVSIPVAIVYNLFMDTFVRGITGGALK